MTNEQIAKECVYKASNRERSVAHIKEALNQKDTEMAKLREENKELNSLFELQRTRYGQAQELWRAESPEERALTSPDLGNLLDWLVSKISLKDSLLSRYQEALETDRGLYTKLLLDLDSMISLIWHRKNNTMRKLVEELGIKHYEFESLLGRLRLGYEQSKKPHELLTSTPSTENKRWEAQRKVIEAAINWRKVFSYEISHAKDSNAQYELESKTDDRLFLAVEEYENALSELDRLNG